MPLHGSENLMENGLALGQPLCMPVFLFSGLCALFFTIINLGEGSAHLTHQLVISLVSHRGMGKGKRTVRANKISAAKTLVDKWHFEASRGVKMDGDSSYSDAESGYHQAFFGVHWRHTDM